jgi:hypothetical protein
MEWKTKPPQSGLVQLQVDEFAFQEKLYKFFVIL